VRERVAAVPTEKLLVAATAVARLREEGVV
jgi:hypothetical protein